MKTFDLDFRKGTLIDSVSKTVGVVNKGSINIIKGNKGNYQSLNNATRIDFPQQILPDGAFTVIIWSKYTGDDSTRVNVIGDVTGNFQKAICTHFSTQHPTIQFGAASRFWATPFYDSKYHHFIFTVNGSDGAAMNTAKCYRDLVELQVMDTATGTPTPRAEFVSIGDGNNPSNKEDVLRIQVFDHILSANEMAKDYQEFLNSSPTEKPIRNFEYPKPTDLSYENGLVAAYNMVPNGNTLVDISGNGNNGTIVGAVSTKEGMSFNGNSNLRAYVIGNSNLQTESSSTTKTMAVRFKHNTGVFTSNERIGMQLFKTNSTTAFGIFGRGPTSKKIAIIYGTPTTTESLDSSVTMDDKIHTAVAVQNGNIINIYIDGVLSATASNAGIPSYASPDVWTIGASVGGGLDWFNGVIYDSRFYNYAFTADEAKAYHNSFIKPVLIEDFSNNAVGDDL